MSLPVQARITPEDEPSKKKRRGPSKGRAFDLIVLAAMNADHLHPLGGRSSSGRERPVLLAFATTAQATAPVIANLRCGRPIAAERAILNTSQVELPKSADYTYSTHPGQDGSLTLAFLPGLFAHRTTAQHDAADISFICLPPTWWIEREAEHLRGALGDDAEEGARAALFAAFIDQRSPLPVANDVRFQLELLRAARGEPWLSDSLKHDGLPELGFDEPLCCSVPASVFAPFLAQLTRKHLPRSPFHGTPRVDRPRRLLPHADPPTPQLALPLFDLG